MNSLVQRVLNVAVVLVVSVAILRAATPNEDDILAQISSPQSENYYPNLILRFEMGDSTLTLNNYHYLYYGYAYQENYKPLNTNPHMDKLLMLASGLDVDNPFRGTLLDIVRVGKQTLEYDPFNPKVWNLLAYAYGGLGDTENELEAYRRVEMIFATIKASGSSQKQSDPQHILMFDHALDMMAAQNLNHSKAMVVSRTVEYIPLVAPLRVDGAKIKGFYFDFGRVYWNKPDSVTYKRDRTWQFNNLPPKEYK